MWVLSPPLALPGHGGVVLEAVEPAADEGVAALDLVVEEGEGEVGVHRLDPEGEAGEFDGEGVEVDAVNAALDDEALEAGADAVLGRLSVLGAMARGGFVDAGNVLQELDEPGGDGRIGVAPADRAVGVLDEPAVGEERIVEGGGEVAQAADHKGARATRGVADLEVEDLGRGAGEERGVGPGHVAERLEGAADGGLGQGGFGVEGATALARAAEADEVVLAGEHQLGDQDLVGARLHLLAVGPFALGGHLAAGLRDEIPGHHSPAGPTVGAVAIAAGLVALVEEHGVERGGEDGGDGGSGVFLGGVGLVGFCIGVVGVSVGFGFFAGGVLRGGAHLRYEPGEGLVIHLLEPGEGQRGLGADVEEEDGDARLDPSELVVEQALVEDADVLGVELGEVHGRHDESGAAALAHLDGGAGDEVEHGGDDAIGNGIAGVLERGERAQDGIGRLDVAGGEEAAAVRGDDELLVGGTAIEKTEQREEAGPGGVAIAQALDVAAAFAVEVLNEPGEGIGVVVDGVAAGQEVAVLGEEEHHEAHDEADGGDVDIAVGDGLGAGGGGVGADLVYGGVGFAQEELDGLAHAFAEGGGEFGLAAAGGEDRFDEVGVRALGRRSDGIAAEEEAQGVDLGAGPAFGEPRTGCPTRTKRRRSAPAWMRRHWKPLVRRATRRLLRRRYSTTRASEPAAPAEAETRGLVAGGGVGGGVVGQEHRGGRAPLGSCQRRRGLMISAG